MAPGEVKEMIKQYNNSKAMMKQSKNRGFFRKLGLG